MLGLYLNVVPGMTPQPAVIARNVARELPFMATENLLMAAVKAGGDRQDLHERIRKHSLASAARLKQGADENDLIARLQSDPAFRSADYSEATDPSRFVGRSPEQVVEFLRGVIEPIRRQNPGDLAQRREVRV
ncbi:MAG: hypothetical protein U0800_05225 [Isosphaeraceae bacterium]